MCCQQYYILQNFQRHVKQRYWSCDRQSEVEWFKSDQEFACASDLRHTGRLAPTKPAHAKLGGSPYKDKDDVANNGKPIESWEQGKNNIRSNHQFETFWQGTISRSTATRMIDACASLEALRSEISLSQSLGRLKRNKLSPRWNRALAV